MNIEVTADDNSRVELVSSSKNKLVTQVEPGLYIMTIEQSERLTVGRQNTALQTSTMPAD